jgi:hypothetical protein
MYFAELKATSESTFDIETGKFSTTKFHHIAQLVG